MKLAWPPTPESFQAAGGWDAMEVGLIDGYLIDCMMRFEAGTTLNMVGC